MDFWAGLGIGVASAVAAGLLALIGVILTNRAARRREEIASQASQTRDDEVKRWNREHELRNSLVDLTKAVRRAEAKWERGLTLAADIDFEERIGYVVWRVSRLNSGYRDAVTKELDRAQAQVQVGFVEDGIARFEELIRSLEGWAVSSVDPLQLPPAPRFTMRNDTTGH